MLKKLLKKIFKKISFNYSEIINKIDENEEKRNHKLIESKQESQYYLENKFEDLNNKLNTINDIFYKKQEEPDSILLQYVSKILLDGKHITLIDVMGEERQLDGTIRMVDLTNSKVIIDCAES